MYVCTLIPILTSYEYAFILVLVHVLSTRNLVCTSMSGTDSKKEPVSRRGIGAACMHASAA